MVDIVLNNDGYEMKNKYANNGSNNYPTEEDRIKLKVIFRKKSRRWFYNSRIHRTFRF